MGAKLSSLFHSAGKEKGKQATNSFEEICCVLFFCEVLLHEHGMKSSDSSGCEISEILVERSEAKPTPLIVPSTQQCNNLCKSLDERLP
jgi:hypothetical protein